MSTFNTAAGWALAGGIVALGSSIVMSEVFHAERPETMGYVVEGVVEDGGGEEAEMSMGEALTDTSVTAERGENIFGRCASCHTINQGGANGIGPNLYGILGNQIAGHAGYDYSDALAGVGGSWNWDNMSQWLASPRNFASGTKMSFAGLSDPYDRASVILYMNEQGSNMALPAAPPPEAEAEEGEEAPADGEEAVPAEDEAPVDDSAEAVDAEG